MLRNTIHLLCTGLCCSVGAIEDLTKRVCMHGSTDSGQHAADDSLLAMLTSNKLQEIATPRSKEPLSSSAATVHSLSAKAGGLDWCASAPEVQAFAVLKLDPTKLFHGSAQVWMWVLICMQHGGWLVLSSVFHGLQRHAE